MTRAELREKFRAENPEITDRVITDSVLNSWMVTANEEVCVETRCIVSEESAVINSIEGTQKYDLEENISRFLDLDDLPGGGVYYNGVPLKKSSPGEENYLNKRWKSASNGIPKRYWKRGKFLWLNVPPDTDDVEIEVDCVLIPVEVNSDDDEFFEGLGHLQPFCDSINKYLQWRTKQKVGKYEEANVAHQDYLTYLGWMRKKVKAGKYGAIFLKSSDK